MFLQMPIPGDRFAKIVTACQRNTGCSKLKLENVHDV
jgi:hypothetical protein